MIKCPFCGADIEDSARFCLYCMQSLTEKEQIVLAKKKKPQWLVIIAAIFAVSAALVIVLLGKQSPSGSETPSGDSLMDTAPTPTQTEVSDPLHIHNFTEENTAIEYRMDAATCITPAVYYYSCICGETGSETFLYGEPADHTPATEQGYPATCTTTGLTDGTYCSVCKTVFLSQTQIPSVSHSYDNAQDDRCNVCNFVRVLNCDHAKKITLPAVSPTCTAGGLSEGKKCDLCEEILTAQTVLAPSGHTPVSGQAIAPTCTTDGKTAGKHCGTCNAVLTAQVSLAAKGHAEVIDPAVAATCTTDGKTAGKHCSVCNTVLTAPVTVSAKGHTEVIDPAVAATCTTSGLTEGKHCALCQIFLVYQQHVPERGHSFSSENPAAPCSLCGLLPHIHSFTEQNTDARYLKTAADCTTAARYYYSCLCGEKGDEYFFYGQAAGHTIQTKHGYPATCTTDGRTDSEYCSVCNDEFGFQAIIYSTGHTFPAGDSPSACQICGEMGNITVQGPDTQHFQNGTFRIDSITYGVLPRTGEEQWDIYVRITGTNISSSPALMSPDCSLRFYDANGSGVQGGLTSAYVQPDKSGTCLVHCIVPNSVDVFKLVIG